MMDPDDVKEMYRVENVPSKKINWHQKRSPSDIVYIRFKGDEGRKRYAWRFAEPLIRHGRAELTD